MAGYDRDDDDEDITNKFEDVGAYPRELTAAPRY